MLWCLFVSVNSGFFLECVLLAAQKEVLHPLVVSARLRVSHGWEGDVDTLLKSMEFECLGRATCLKQEQPFPMAGS